MLPVTHIAPDEVRSTGLPSRFTNPGEYGTLVALARSVGATRFLETGINQGRTAAMFLRNMPQIARYVGIDVPPETHLPLSVQRDEVPAIAGEYVQNDLRVTVIVREGGSFNVQPHEIGQVDFAFIDGDHSEAGIVRDTELAKECVRNGGLIVWHDYHNFGTVDVKRVLDKWQAEGQPIRHVHGTWLAVMTNIKA